MTKIYDSYPDISIHAPRAGGDYCADILRSSQNQFQSTPPVRGATRSTSAYVHGSGISIHAPRAGGDPISMGDAMSVELFQSTPPVRGATVKIRIFIRIFK